MGPRAEGVVVGTSVGQAARAHRVLLDRGLEDVRGAAIRDVAELDLVGREGRLPLGRSVTGLVGGPAAAAHHGAGSEEDEDEGDDEGDGDGEGEYAEKKKDRNNERQG